MGFSDVLLFPKRAVKLARGSGTLAALVGEGRRGRISFPQKYIYAVRENSSVWVLSAAATA